MQSGFSVFDDKWIRLQFYCMTLLLNLLRRWMFMIIARGWWYLLLVPTVVLLVVPTAAILPGRRVFVIVAWALWLRLWRIKVRVLILRFRWWYPLLILTSTTVILTSMTAILLGRIFLFCLLLDRTKLKLKPNFVGYICVIEDIITTMFLAS